MLKDRGCATVEHDSDIFNNTEDTSPCIKGRGGIAIDVYFHKEERVGVKFLRTVLDDSQSDENIIVSLDGPTTFTKREADDTNVQFFTFRELFVNIVKHTVVPKHESVPIESIPWSANELPHISTADPVVRYYNFPVGTVVKITRVFGAHEPHPYYRLVTAT